MMKNVTGLRMDIDAGEGEVKVSAEFSRQSFLFQADVLGDWKHDIGNLYEAAVEGLHAELAGISVKKLRRNNLEKIKSDVKHWEECAESLVGAEILGVTRGSQGEFLLQVSKGGKASTTVFYPGGHFNNMNHVGCENLDPEEENV